MICYECDLLGKRQDAAAMCHHCSGALCSEHAAVLGDPVTEQYPIYSGSSFCRSKPGCFSAIRVSKHWNRRGSLQKMKLTSSSLTGTFFTLSAYQTGDDQLWRELSFALRKSSFSFLFK
jgi:hypothetical protein